MQNQIAVKSFFLVFNQIRGQYLNLKHNFLEISSAFRTRLVKTAKASPNAKVYSLGTEYTVHLNIWNVLTLYE